MILRSTRVVLPDGVRPASIHVEDGRIVRVEPGSPRGAADAGAIDVGSLAVSPGIVDPHVHVNEPGRTEWEGFDTATRAADIWKKTLDEYEEPPMDEELKAELKAYVDRRRTELGD